MDLRTATVMAHVASLALLPGSAEAQDRDIVNVDGWSISAHSDGRGPCRLEKASADGLLRYSTNRSITVVGGTIGEVDTRRSVPLTLVVNGRPATVRATAARFGEDFGYTFTPRQRPPFTQGFDLVVLRGENVVFRHEVQSAADAFEELLDCGRNPFWPEPF